MIHTPGHSPGHVCYYAKSLDYVFCGDLILGAGVGCVGSRMGAALKSARTMGRRPACDIPRGCCLGAEGRRVRCPFHSALRCAAGGRTCTVGTTSSSSSPSAKSAGRCVCGRRLRRRPTCSAHRHHSCLPRGLRGLSTSAAPTESLCDAPSPTRPQVFPNVTILSGHAAPVELQELLGVNPYVRLVNGGRQDPAMAAAAGSGAAAGSSGAGATTAGGAAGGRVREEGATGAAGGEPEDDGSGHDDEQRDEL